MDNQFGRVVSFGPLCTSKHQMRRVLIERQGLGIGRRGKTVVPGSPSAVFDWQITPLPVLFDYLQRDFAGMFEHDDLTLRGGTVVNARYGTEHPHEFPKLNSVAEIAAHYPTARSRHDYLCAKTRFMLTDDVPTLFLFSRTLGHSQMTELRDMIGSLRAGRFRILAAGDESTGWMGQDRLWDDALAPFEFYHAAEATIAEPVTNVADLIASQMRRLHRHIKALQF